MSRKTNPNQFVIPQKRAGKHFNEATATRDIERIALEKANGKVLIDVPVQVNVRNAVPGVFRLPLRAWVHASSVLARVFGVRIVLDLDDNE